MASDVYKVARYGKTTNRSRRSFDEIMIGEKR